jgi:HAD superfamily hydrolase (TIGR01509 family)
MKAKFLKPDCIIFDLDGTLVDSEPLCSQAYLDVLPDLTGTIQDFEDRYRGWQYANVNADLQQRLGRTLPADFEDHYRARVYKLFEENLTLFPDVMAVLNELDMPICVASNGPMVKMRKSMSLTGLDTVFGADIFSAYDIGSWKPDPGLFLHAAERMGVDATKCLVIEDSDPGIEAAKAAGMAHLLFTPGTPPGDDRTRFNAYGQFADLLANWQDIPT